MKNITSRLGVLALVLIALPPAEAAAQSRTFYDSSTGKVIGRSTTDTGGAATFYGPNGRVAGRTFTGSNGTTTIYGPDGRAIRSVVARPHAR